jgi:hypothetical protein
MQKGISFFGRISVIALIPAGLLAQQISGPGKGTDSFQAAPTRAPEQPMVASVSDATAYRLFFLMIAKRPNADPAFDLRRRTAYLKHYFPRQLTAEQMQHLLVTADALSMNFGFRNGQLLTASTTRVLKEKQDEAITTAVNSLALADPDAAAKVRLHVLTHVKAVIRAHRPTMNP